ncbi:MAG: patatin-like phospholipase family protein [Bacteroidales bacterium]|nr:patatin-like phospholipase family protein [Bacteroidales bacterium]
MFVNRPTTNRLPIANLLSRVLLTVLCTVPLVASTAQPLSYGINEQYDNMALQRIWARMDSIKTQRPTVAVVLSGGGAKGAAHLGTLQYLEEIGMPIDLILGTSIGGLVGGLYACGYSACQLEDIIRHIDWQSILTDRIDRHWLSAENRRHNDRYLITIPYMYSPKGMLDMSNRRINLSADASSGILSSMPSGIVYGQHVGNLFSSLTIGYQDETDFFDLPLPFACIATEMVTSKQKIWMSGHLNTALRSTMSIPGLFTTVKTDSMVLVDGGMRNNFPTDLARIMGADIVIGVDVSSPSYRYDELNNLLDVASQAIDLPGRDAYLSNLQYLDVLIKPLTAPYHMLSFESASIDSLIARGKKAVVGHRDRLLAIREQTGGADRHQQHRPAVNLNDTSLQISACRFEGVTQAESRYLSQMIDFLQNDSMYVTRTLIEKAVNILYGTKAFDYVNFELRGREEPYELVFNCRPGPVNRLSVGARFDTEEYAALLFNLGLNSWLLAGHELDLTGRLSANPALKLRYTDKRLSIPDWNLSLEGRYNSTNRFGYGDYTYQMDFFHTRFQAWISSPRRKKTGITLGLQAESYFFKHALSNYAGIEDLLQNEYFRRNHYLSLFAGIELDSRNDNYFPDEGIYFKASYNWMFSSLAKYVEPFHSLQADFETAWSMHPDFTLLPSLHFRHLLGNEIPWSYFNLMGGQMAGRFSEQQMAFMGVEYVQAMPDQLGIAALKLRYSPARNHYLTGIYNMAYTAEKPEDYFLSGGGRIYNGCGLEYAYNSVIGPFRIDFYWSDLRKKPGAYVSLGLDF